MRPATTKEFYYRLRVVRSKKTRSDDKQRVQKIHLEKWVAQQIAKLGTNAPRVKGKGRKK